MRFHSPMILACCIVLALNEVLGIVINRQNFSKYLSENLKPLIYCGLMFILAYLGAYEMNTNSVCAIYAFIYAGRKMDFRRIAKWVLAVSVICMAVVVLSAHYGLVENYVYTRSRTRASLGFMYPLFAPSLFLSITCLTVYIRGKKTGFLEILLLAAVDFWLYYQTRSRLTFASTLAVLTGAVILHFCQKKTNNSKTAAEEALAKETNIKTTVTKGERLFSLLSYIYPAAFAVSFIIALAYNPAVEWMKKINVLFEARISLAQDSLSKYGITILGRQLEWKGAAIDSSGVFSTGAYDYVDNFYIQITQRYGLLYAVLLMAELTVSMRKLSKERQWHFILVLAVIALHLIIDDLLLYPCYNVFWIGAGLVFIQMLLPEKSIPPNSMPASSIQGNSIQGDSIPETSILADGRTDAER